MGDPRVIEEGEMSVEDVMSALENGERVVVLTEFLGSEHRVTLRHDGDTYYCDTPARLHKHDSPEKMRTCLRNQGYAE